jgi:hypothetical protein
MGAITYVVNFGDPASSTLSYPYVQFYSYGYAFLAMGNVVHESFSGD